MQELKPEIIPAEYAGGVGHMAAARLSGMIQEDPEGLSHNWFDPHRDDLETEMVNEIIFAAANYCTRQDSYSGERLYRWMVIQGLIVLNADEGWTGEDVLTRNCFDVFTRTCEAVALPLQNQINEQNRADQLAETKSEPLKKADSIFEEEEGLGDIDPDRKRALAMAAKPNKPKKPVKPKKPKKPVKPKKPTKQSLGAVVAGEEGNGPETVGEVPEGENNPNPDKPADGDGDPHKGDETGSFKGAGTTTQT